VDLESWYKEFGSANNMESIDRAVLDRFDLKIEFSPPGREQLHAACQL